MKRYGLAPQFNDPDFDMDEEPRKFWTMAGVRKAWNQREIARRQAHITQWRWTIIDLRTGEDIT